MAIVPVNINYFEELPKDLFPQFLSHIKLKGIHSLLLTNRDFNNFISGCNALWQSLVRSDFLYPFPHPLPFMKLYRGLKIRQDNVKANNSQERDLMCSNVNELAMHEQLFYISTEGFLQLLDVDSDTELHTFSGHNQVSCFAVDGNILATGSFDGTTKLWDLTTREELHTFTNEETVICLSLKGDFIACGFSDSTIKIWNVKTKEEHFTTTDSDQQIKFLALQENRLVYGGSSEIRVIDLASGQVDALPTGLVHCFVMQGNTLIADVELHDQRVILIHDFDTNETHTIDGGSDLDPPRYCLAVQGNLCFGATLDGTITVWDLKSKKELQTFEDERGSVRSLAVKGGELFVSANDGSVKVYDFSAGSALNARSSSSVVHFPFLEELGIRSVKDHLEKLNCLPSRLKKIGIVTQEDLHRICKPYTAVVNQIPLEADVSQDLLQKEKIAGRRKETLVEALKTMSNVLEEMTTEAKNSNGVLYEEGCPWEGLENEIKLLEDEIHSIMKGDRKQVVEAFDADNYNRMASQWNALIQKFNQEVPEMHREHQVNKLRAFVDYCVVSEASN